ncbi:MAG: hypothetical protein ACR2OB_01535 [Solirubrobacteraceae bacterium]
MNASQNATPKLFWNERSPKAWNIPTQIRMVPMANPMAKAR